MDIIIELGKQHNGSASEISIKDDRATLTKECAMQKPKPVLFLIVVVLALSACGKQPVPGPTVPVPTNTSAPTITPVPSLTPTLISKPDVEDVLLANGFLRYPKHDGVEGYGGINPYQYYQYCNDAENLQCPRKEEVVGDSFARVFNDGDLVFTLWIASTYPSTKAYATGIKDHSKVLTGILEALYPQDVVQWINSEMEGIKAIAMRGEDYLSPAGLVGPYIININHNENFAEKVNIQISTSPVTPTPGHYVGQSPNVSFTLTGDGITNFKYENDTCTAAMEGVTPLNNLTGEYNFNRKSQASSGNSQVLGMFMGKKVAGYFKSNECSGDWKAEWTES
jgi:hypothetical protein